MALSCALVLSSATPGTGSATGIADIKVLLHLASPTTSQQCTRAAAQPVCANVVTKGALYPNLYYAYVLMADGDPVAGISGAAFGINYDSGASDGIGVDVFGWTLCASLM